MDNDADALQWCMRLARTHYENFPVASFLLPKRMRIPITVVYAFARVADDIGDEPWRLDNVIADKGARLRGLALMDAIAESPADFPHHPVARALTTIASRMPSSTAISSDGGIDGGIDAGIDGGIDAGFDGFRNPLQRLVTAFRSDIMFTPPSGWHDVHAYCNNSANPVGELVLRTSGTTITPAMMQQSNAICTALQIINFLQDLSVDLQRHRHYLPCEHINGSCIAEACTIAESLLKQGVPLTRNRALPWRLRQELRLIVAGGTRMLMQCGRMGTGLLRRRPTLGLLDYICMIA